MYKQVTPHKKFLFIPLPSPCGRNPKNHVNYSKAHTPQSNPHPFVKDGGKNLNFMALPKGHLTSY